MLLIFKVGLLQLSASGRLSLHACYRSLLARTPTAHQNATSNLPQSGCHVSPAPIRVPCTACTNQDPRAFVTPWRPKANSIHTAALYAKTRTHHQTQGCTLSNIYFYVSLIYLLPACVSYVGNECESQLAQNSLKKLTYHRS